MRILSISKLPFLTFTVIAFSFLANSCSPDSFKDDADDFVGTYKASVIENVRWGSDGGTLTPTGTFYISKVSASRVKVSGYIDTYGEVNGKTVYFESMYDSDSEGYITTQGGQSLPGGFFVFIPHPCSAVTNTPHATSSLSALSQLLLAGGHPEQFLPAHLPG